MAAQPLTKKIKVEQGMISSNGIIEMEIHMKIVVTLGILFVLSFVMTGCFQATATGPFAQASIPSSECGEGWVPCERPSNVYKPRCNGPYSVCGYDAARNHNDANPNN
jgi:hypothetical protein